MNDKPKIAISWSGGKDSAMALEKIITEGQYEIDHLHTVIDHDNRRVGLHGVGEELIEQQAESLQIPLRKLYLQASKDHSNYESLVKDYYLKLKSEGINYVLFGDIFLEDLKDYRDKMLLQCGVEGIYPLWKLNTSELLEEFLDKGFKTLICAANKAYFSESELGKTIDRNFSSQLNEAVDPCGENGEFHTFVYDGPIFTRPINVERHEVVEKSYSYKQQDVDGKLITLTSSFLFQELK